MLLISVNNCFIFIRCKLLKIIIYFRTELLEIVIIIVDFSRNIFTAIETFSGS